MITFDGVTKQYPGQMSPALSAATLHVGPGEFVFLVGPSGSGKSTFLRLCLAEDTASSGAVWIDGVNVATLKSRQLPHLRRKIGAVFQDFRLLPNKTVAQNVAFALQVTGGSRALVASRVPEALDMVGLADKAARMPHELSGGEQQRVALARAIVNDPPLLIADEPTGNLDPSTTDDIMGLLAMVHDTGTTIVMATHDAAVVDRHSHRVVEITDGTIVRDQLAGDYVNPAVRMG